MAAGINDNDREVDGAFVAEDVADYSALRKVLAEADPGGGLRIAISTGREVMLSYPDSLALARYILDRFGPTLPEILKR